MSQMRVNTTVNTEVEGLLLQQQLVDLVAGNLSDPNKVSRINDMLIAHLSLFVAFDQGTSLSDAAQWVQARISRVQ